MNNKILIIVPAQIKGGVYYYYKNLSKVLNSDFYFYYMNHDKISYKNKIILSIIHLKKIVTLIKDNNFKKIIINPSLLLNSIIRDSFYIGIFRLLKIEVCCFWRGWDKNNEKYFKFPYKTISNNFLTVSSMIVLHSGVKSFFKKKKYTGSIKILTTIVDKLAFDYKISDNNDLNIIFLSRLEIYKGIYELLQIYDIIIKYKKNVKLIIAGSGNEFLKVKQIINCKKYNGVSLVGHIEEEGKYKLLSKSSIYILPSYSEGMPNSILEAMAVGLPVITTRVGAMNDFFKDNIMGKFIDIKNLQLSAHEILNLLEDKDKMRRISRYNINYAEKNFSDNVVAENFSKTIYGMI